MILDNLNQEQRNAASSPLGNNLIIASAGTGKTSTIVARVAFLLGQNILAENIMLLTFTNKAAMEIIKRVSTYFPEQASKIKAGTFHSISYKLLKEKSFNLKLKRPNELKTLLKGVYEHYITDDSNMAYTHLHLYDIHSLYLNTFDTESFEEYIFNKYEKHRDFALIYQNIMDDFYALKQEYNYVSFDDLLMLSQELIEKENISFDEVIIDEYQDTNPLQSKFIDKMQKKSLFCVGDYDQSIYAFNGADINIISTFKDRYENATVFSLSKNYRSTSAILDLATRVISNNERIYPKKLEVVRQDTNIPPKLLVYSELYEQYSEISEKIAKSSSSYDDIAVIYRNNSSADGIESSLRNLGIKAKRKGGISFFDTKEIKIIFDILSLLGSKNDLMSFVNIFSYNHGIGAKIAKDIFHSLLKLGDGHIINGFLNPNNTKINIQQSLMSEDNLEVEKNLIYHSGLKKESLYFIESLKDLLFKIRKNKNPQDIVKQIASSKFYETIKNQLCFVRSLRKDGTNDEALKTIAKESITRKLELLINISKPYRKLETFIHAMVLGSSEISSKNGVNLLSIHASKGLEFKEVFVIDLMDGRFPNTTLMAKSNTGMDEERRLFYVATTRAKDILYLSFSKYDKIKRITYKPSPFLIEAKLISQ
jgi:DNA helicase-2/ATP-dependent DNA helicase PcrA